jgi:hypothetical protein
MFRGLSDAAYGGLPQFAIIGHLPLDCGEKDASSNDLLLE